MPNPNYLEHEGYLRGRSGVENNRLPEARCGNCHLGKRAITCCLNKGRFRLARKHNGALVSNGEELDLTRASTLLTRIYQEACAGKAVDKKLISLVKEFIALTSLRDHGELKKYFSVLQQSADLDQFVKEAPRAVNNAMAIIGRAIAGLKSDFRPAP